MRISNWRTGLLVVMALVIASAAFGQYTGATNAPFKAPLGSAALPSFSWVSDPDSGFYRYGSNQIGWSTNGIPRGIFSSAGITLLNGGKFSGGTFNGVDVSALPRAYYTRITAGDLNTAAASGISLLPAISGKSYRILNARIAAYGGDTTSTNATGVNITSDLGGTPVILYNVLKAELTRSSTAGVGINVMVPTTANTVILADNASFTAQVANKAVSFVETTTSTYDFAGATGFDVWVDYVLE